MKTKLLVGLLGISAVALSADALTIHRSFRRRDIGFGGGASVSVPVDARVDKAISEGRQALKKERSIVGRVTKITGGDMITVTPNGGTATKVRLRNIDAPEADQPGGDKATEFLKGLVNDKKVEVKFAGRDKFGFVFGTVYFKSDKGQLVDLNLTMVLNGWAWNDSPSSSGNMATAYGKAEQSARAAKTGLWAEANPVRPSEWRNKSK